ncbi:hypothetical protein KJY73_05530 [Bowmanella sp. Y26]|uniref:hypothetical protein n=1 Tax=Bowmanella yangjiangensis TaxID=2811230 RepID=UPI001BDCE1F5|nr:hypothetical protein [Bowmanella yangjiangensis]MBT1063026.1 hypothetical protein [Bowmanella yangjiangensis]
MSAYQSDTIKFRGNWYQLIDGGLFSPRDYGIAPCTTDSYTPLGYSASFGLINKHLHLFSLYSNHHPDQGLLSQQPQAGQWPLEHTEVSPTLDDPLDSLFSPNRRQRIQPPALNGVQASPASDNFWFYPKVNLPLNYSGTLIIDRMPILTGDESEHSIREAIREIIESDSNVTGWTLQFVNGKLVAETAHEPNEQLAELIECYGLKRPLDVDAPAPINIENISDLNTDYSPAQPTNKRTFDDDSYFDDFEIEPPTNK